MNNFKIPKNNWKKFPIDSVKFILQEAKEYVGYTLEESNKITNRAYSLVILLSTVLAAIVGYTSEKIYTCGISNIIASNIFFAFVITVLIVVLATLVFPREIMAKGRIPSVLATEKLLNNPKLNSDETYLAFLIREIENTQDKIDFNLSKNRSRRNKLKISMYVISAIFPLYLIIALIIVS